MKTNSKGNMQGFLKKVMLLRGFGDMDSYKVISEYRELAEERSHEKLDLIIADFSDPKTYEKGKEKLIKEVRSFLDRGMSV